MLHAQINQNNQHRFSILYRTPYLLLGNGIVFPEENDYGLYLGHYEPLQIASTNSLYFTGINVFVFTSVMKKGNMKWREYENIYVFSFLSCALSPKRFSVYIYLRTIMFHKDCTLALPNDIESGVHSHTRTISFFFFFSFLNFEYRFVCM